MNYRVVEVGTGEIRGVLGTFAEAKQLADTLAQDGRFEERFAVIDAATAAVVYQTPPRKEPQQP